MKLGLEGQQTSPKLLTLMVIISTEQQVLFSPVTEGLQATTKTLQDELRAPLAGLQLLLPPLQIALTVILLVLQSMQTQTFLMTQTHQQEQVLQIGEAKAFSL